MFESLCWLMGMSDTCGNADSPGVVDYPVETYMLGSLVLYCIACIMAVIGIALVYVCWKSGKEEENEDA